METSQTRLKRGDIIQLFMYDVINHLVQLEKKKILLEGSRSFLAGHLMWVSHQIPKILGAFWHKYQEFNLYKYPPLNPHFLFKKLGEVLAISLLEIPQPKRERKRVENQKFSWGFYLQRFGFDLGRTKKKFEKFWVTFGSCGRG